MSIQGHGPTTRFFVMSVGCSKGNPLNWSKKLIPYKPFSKGLIVSDKLMISSFEILIGLVWCHRSGHGMTREYAFTIVGSNSVFFLILEYAYASPCHLTQAFQNRPFDPSLCLLRRRCAGPSAGADKKENMENQEQGQVAGWSLVALVSMMC